MRAIAILLMLVLVASPVVASHGTRYTLPYVVLDGSTMVVHVPALVFIDRHERGTLRRPPYVSQPIVSDPDAASLARAIRRVGSDRVCTVSNLQAGIIAQDHRTRTRVVTDGEEEFLGLFVRDLEVSPSRLQRDIGAFSPNNCRWVRADDDWNLLFIAVPRG